jgi:hypothetical protein
MASSPETPPRPESQPSSDPASVRKRSRLDLDRETLNRSQKKKEQLRRHQSVLQWLSWAATIIGAVVAWSTLFNLPWADFVGPDRQATAQAKSLERRVSSLEQRLTKLQAQSQATAIEPRLPQEQQTAFESRVHTLESAILESPEKALSLVLFKRDIGELRAALAAAEASSQREIARIYDLTKIAVGAIFGMVLGVLGLVITQVLPKRGAAPAPEK